MILTSFLFAVLLCCCKAQSSENEELPLQIATLGRQGELKASNLLPEIDETMPLLTGVQSSANRGRGDIEIEEEQGSRGYFYPRPAKPFNLPEFKTLAANVPLDGVYSFAQEDDIGLERLPRSPRRRRPQFPSPPPFVPGFFPSNNYRPLPALYGRPVGF